VRIVHIGTADNDGGAARAAFRLHTGLLQAGHDSRMLVGHRIEPDRGEIDVVPRWTSVAERAWHAAARRVERVSGLQYLLLPWGRQILDHQWIREADVIHLHNLHGGFFPIRILPELSRLAPLVWSVCDFWLMTGHCSYPDFVGCERWRAGCGSCPDLKDYPSIEVDTTRLLWSIKRRVYSRCRVRLAAKSRWALKILAESPVLAGFDKVLVPNGYRTDVFRPLPRGAAREMLGLAEDAPVVFLGAHDISGPRKGAAYLLPALQRVGRECPGLTLLTAGLDTAQMTGRFDSCRVINLGMLRSDHLLAMCYCAADVTILPTVSDNSPNVMYESLACGVPVVAFDVGGVPDAVRHMETGYLARARDADDLAAGLITLLTDGELRQRLGANARDMMMKEFSLDRQVERFLRLYTPDCSQSQLAPSIYGS
jgi:glycosyltransferase involved in cell wall biosynthesis